MKIEMTGEGTGPTFRKGYEFSRQRTMSHSAHPWTMRIGWSKTLGTDPGLQCKPSGQSLFLEFSRESIRNLTVPARVAKISKTDPEGRVQVNTTASVKHLLST